MSATVPAGPEPAPGPTLEINLTAIRDLARYLAASRPAVTGWQLVAAGDVDAFPATIASPANRARQLHALRVFFRWARSHRIILADPARGLRPTSNIPFHGRLLSAAEQRQLLRRWTAGAERLHPHEPAAGLLGLLHGASAGELRHLRATDIDLGRRWARGTAGSNRASAARTARSAQSGLGRATWRRSTVTS
jgi:integrase